MPHEDGGAPPGGFLGIVLLLQLRVDLDEVQDVVPRDDANLRVKLKAEFEGGNADMYRPEAVVGAGPQRGVNGAPQVRGDGSF